MSVEKKTCAAGSFPRKIDLIYAREAGDAAVRDRVACARLDFRVS